MLVEATLGFKQNEAKNRLSRTGTDHRRWLAGDRSPKPCAYCGGQFEKQKTEAITTFWKRKFCSKDCADKGGFRYTGEQHPNYRADARRKNRGGSHHKWVNAVISRDHATCQHCGAQNVELHAHHIKSYKNYPELRFDIANGLTLCFACHWRAHTAENENPANSGNTLTDHAEGNPEPSLQGNLLEGVTTRGRACRRWIGQCGWCKTVISKRLSDIKGKVHLFCGSVCAGKFIAANREYRRWKNPIFGSNASTSTGREKRRDSLTSWETLRC